MKRRVALILLVALGLAPGLYWREAPPPPNAIPLVVATQIVSAGARIGGKEGPVVEGVWRLTSLNDMFGSYSALLALDDGSLLGLSDRGQFMRLLHPPGGLAEFGEIFPRLIADKRAQDVESATRDAEDGRIWLGLEGRNAIVRTNADFGAHKEGQPPAMRDWPGNRGPEALVRLRDGRFVVLSEGRVGPSGRNEGLLFRFDPVDGARAQEFSFAPPGSEVPSDMAQLPDGRVLVLTRGIQVFGLPPHFTASLLLVDPASIRKGKDWRWRRIAAIGGNAVPYENYEGIAVSGGANGGPVTIWLICDDNQSLVLQRTLLVKLRWQPPARS